MKGAQEHTGARHKFPGDESRSHLLNPHSRALKRYRTGDERNVDVKRVTVS